MKEIGSEFYLSEENFFQNGNNCVNTLNLYENSAYAFSGRTAFEMVLKDIRNIEKVLFPSYCCQSMLDPFVNSGVQIEFYNVNSNEHFNIELEIPDDCSVLVWCNYFGYINDYPDKTIDDFKQRGGIVIEDITHSLLSLKPYHEQSDYLVASLRKWGPLICGGYYAKKSPYIIKKPKSVPDSLFIKNKRNAMIMKSQYITGLENVIKENYLKLFLDSNKWIENNYSDLVIDSLSEQLFKNWDLDYIRKERINNAKILHEGIKKLEHLKLLFPEEKMDCPLFVPVVFQSSSARDKIRQFLNSKNIYCPIHWPRPKMDVTSNMYNLELSLVCDQRYNSRDMNYVIDVLHEGIQEFLD